MIPKPIINSATNRRYQTRIDALAALAAASDWTGIAAFEVKGVNTYAKVVQRYRDALLAASLTLNPAPKNPTKRPFLRNRAILTLQSQGLRRRDSGAGGNMEVKQ